MPISLPPISLPLILIASAGLMVLVFLIMALMGAVGSRKTNDPNDDPRCGACGCIVADSTALVCRTCGSPISAVGLVLPFSKKRTTSFTSRQAFYKVTAFPLALWTLFIVGVAIGGAYAIDQYLLPYVWQSTSTVHARPRSRGCDAILIRTLEEYRARGRVQLDSPSAIRATWLELKTETGSHVLNVDLLAPSFSYSQATGKPISQNRLPNKSDVIAFMRSSGIPLGANAAQEAGIIAGMLSNFTPQQSAVINSRDPRASTLDTTQIAFNGGQWKTPIELKPLAMYSSSGLWLFGFILIIWLQRGRRARVAAGLLAPPLPATPSFQVGVGDTDAEGGWDITVDGQDPFHGHRSSPQLPLTPPRPASISGNQPVTLKKV